MLKNLLRMQHCIAGGCNIDVVEKGLIYSCPYHGFVHVCWGLDTCPKTEKGVCALSNTILRDPPPEDQPQQGRKRKFNEPTASLTKYGFWQALQQTVPAANEGDPFYVSLVRRLFSLYNTHATVPDCFDKIFTAVNQVLCKGVEPSGRIGKEVALLITVDTQRPGERLPLDRSYFWKKKWKK